MLTPPQMLLRAVLDVGAQVVITSRIGAPEPAVELIESHQAWLEGQGVEGLVMPDGAHAVAAARGALDAGRRGLLLLEAGAVPETGVLMERASRGHAKGAGAVVLAAGPVDRPEGRRACDAWGAAGAAVFEPALHAEVMPWFGQAMEAAALAGGVAVLGMAAELWHGFASVTCGPRPSSPGQPTAAAARQGAGHHQERLLVRARETGVNVIVNPPGRDEALPLGLIAGGVGYARLRQVISELGLIGRLPILRLGLSEPMDGALLQRHARDCQALLVVDHRGGALYRGVADVLGQPRDGAGGTQVRPLLVGDDLSPGAILTGLAPHLRGHPAVPGEVLGAALDGLEAQVRGVSGGDEERPHGVAAALDVLPPPGSALVDVAAVLGGLRRDLVDAQYMSEQHGQGPAELAFFGPLDDLSRALLASDMAPVAQTDLPGTVAGSAAHAAGACEGVRPVVLMSGREFFASGYASIANASRGDREITFIIHTEEPARLQGPRRRGWPLRRRRAPGALDMQAMLGALAADGIHRGVSVGEIDPTDRPRFRKLLERSLIGPGVHVVLARRRVGPRAMRQFASQAQQESVGQGYLASQQRLVYCPEVWPLNRPQRLQLGPLGLEHEPREPGGWMAAGSWAWGGKPMLKALANPALGLATIQRSGPERVRFDESALADLPPLPHPRHANQEVWRGSVAGYTLAGLDLLAELLSEAGVAMGYQVRGSRTDTLAHAGGRVDVVFSSRPREQALTVAGAPGRLTHALSSTAPTPGSTDLIIGTDANQAVFALEALGNRERTVSVVDTVSLPTVAALASGLPDADPGRLARALSGHARPDGSASVPAAAISEYLWGHRRYGAWVLLGAAMQMGLVPVHRQAVEAATRRVLGCQDERCRMALDVGRKLAVEPGFLQERIAGGDDSPEAALDTVTQDLAQQFGGRVGPTLSRELYERVAPLLKRCAALERPARARLVQAAHRCVLWGGKRHGLAYARRYCETIELLLDHDSPEQGYALTHAGIEGAARVMVIPDEVYLAAQLTSPARYRRDRRRLNIALESGDRVRYRHVVRPEFDLFKRHVVFTVTLGERALHLLARLHLARRVRAGWYREQRVLRDLYLDTLSGVSETSGADAYRKWCEIAASTAQIEGRGGVRRQTVREARTRLDRLVAVDAKQLANP